MNVPNRGNGPPRPTLAAYLAFAADARAQGVAESVPPNRVASCDAVDAAFDPLPNFLAHDFFHVDSRSVDAYNARLRRENLAANRPADHDLIPVDQNFDMYRKFAVCADHQCMAFHRELLNANPPPFAVDIVGFFPLVCPFVPAAPGAQDDPVLRPQRPARQRPVAAPRQAAPQNPVAAQGQAPPPNGGAVQGQAALQHPRGAHRPAAAHVRVPARDPAAPLTPPRQQRRRADRGQGTPPRRRRRRVRRVVLPLVLQHRRQVAPAAVQAAPGVPAPRPHVGPAPLLVRQRRGARAVAVRMAAAPNPPDLPVQADAQDQPDAPAQLQHVIEIVDSDEEAKDQARAELLQHLLRAAAGFLLQRQ